MMRTEHYCQKRDHVAQLVQRENIGGKKNTCPGTTMSIAGALRKMPATFSFSVVHSFDFSDEIESATTSPPSESADQNK
jgi:hypothetical protein